MSSAEFVELRLVEIINSQKCVEHNETPKGVIFKNDKVSFSNGCCKAFDNFIKENIPKFMNEAMKEAVGKTLRDSGFGEKR